MPPLKGSWVPHDTRDEIVDYVHYWNGRTDIPARQIVAWAGLGSSKFYDWKQRYGKVNESGGLVPRDFWLEEWEKQAIIDFHGKHPLEGYHRTIKGECLRFHSPLSLDEARRLVEDYVRHYNEVRLHSGIGYVAPLIKLEGRDKQVFAERDRKLEEARERRKSNRQAAAANQAIASATDAL